jgi:ABC-type polysaccharide/polyol phosphate export permease
MTQAALNATDKSLTDELMARRQIGGQIDTLPDDFREALRSWPIWVSLGNNDVRQRYRRSTIGPFWITISMGVMIGTLGVIYSQVFHTEIRTYLPYLCLGFVVWGFLSTSIGECCKAFQDSESIIHQIKIPYSCYILRVVWRNFVIFLHTIVIFVPVTLLFDVPVNWMWLLALPGMALLFLNCLWLGMVLAILGARFRDVPLIVTNLLQIVFFSTPILWQAGGMAHRHILADLNPVYHLMELVRAPLLGEAPAIMSWVASGALLVAGAAVAMLLFRRASRRIVYWL